MVNKPRQFYVTEACLQSWEKLATPHATTVDNTEAGVLARSLTNLIDAYRYARTHGPRDRKPREKRKKPGSIDGQAVQGPA